MALGWWCGRTGAEEVEGPPSAFPYLEEDAAALEGRRDDARAGDGSLRAEPALLPLDAAECAGVGWAPAGARPREPIQLPSDRLVLIDHFEFDAYVLPAVDTEMLLDEDRAKAGAGGPWRVGISRPLEQPLTWIWHGAADDGGLWSAAIVSPGALEVRLHFAAVDLPPGAEIYVYSPGRGEMPLGPYTGAGPRGSGEFWTGSVAGDTVYVECYVPSGPMEGAPVEIDRVGHKYRGVEPGQVAGERDSRGPLDCMGDVACYGDWEDISYAVARMDYFSDDEGGAWYNCTGTLLATENGDQTPYFLTSAHCIDEQNEADTLECCWLYQRSSCGGAFMSTKYSYDAEVLATSGGEVQADWSLLMVKGVLPPGVYWSGWTTATPSNGEWSVTVHHPAASWKRYSRGQRWPYSAYFHRIIFNVTGAVGTVYFGSSGSGIWRESDQKLFGNSSWVSSPYAGCDYLDTYAGYGRFSTYYSTISSLLAAGSDDSFEDNDSCAAAVDLEPGTYNGLVVKSLDEDWHRIALGPGGELDLDLSFIDSYGNINVELYDSCGGAVVASATSATNNESLNYVNPGGAADFYLRIYLYDDTRNTYDLTCDFPQFIAPAAAEDEVTTTVKLTGQYYGTVPGPGTCSFDAECNPGGAAQESECIDGVCYFGYQRYLRFNPMSAGLEVALRTTHVGTGSEMWVGVPETIAEPGSSRTVAVARLRSTPLYRDWGGDPILAAGCMIVPGEEYAIQALPLGADPGNPDDYSEALRLPTNGYGDGVSEKITVCGFCEDDPLEDCNVLLGDCPGGGVCIPKDDPATARDPDCSWYLPGNGAANFNDVAGAVFAYQGYDNASLAHYDLALPETNRVVNFTDIQFMVFAFGAGAGYLDYEDHIPPASCPEPALVDCETDHDCPYGQTCTDGGCACATELECPAGRECVYSSAAGRMVCRIPCVGDGDCPPNGLGGNVRCSADDKFCVYP